MITTVKKTFEFYFKSNKFEFKVKGESVKTVTESAGKTEASIGAIKESFDDSKRDDQKFGDQWKSESISFELYCLTDKRFLEVFDDHKSGRIKHRLREEFLKIGIKTTELEVDIENMEEVEKRKKDIERYWSAYLTKQTRHFEHLESHGVDSCKPEKCPMFTGREAEIQKVIALLKDEEMAIVSLHGGPGIGKTAIATEVSHKLSEDHKIPVIFSELTTATNEDEMIRQLCLDAGVNYEDDPKKSLMLWLKNVKKKIILVMDDIDNLLKKDRSCLYHFIRLLLRNSDCQIVTTSQSSYLIPQLSISKVLVGQMEAKACMELLKKQCPQENDQFLQRLAELCGKIPLAMCIAASLVDDFEDSDELLQYLEKQPMRILECPESDQYIKRAIEMSYEKCSDEEQETLVRLSVFEGSFTTDAAKVVIEKDKLDTSRILKKLVSLSLMEQPTKHRYSIHLLIKHFLKDVQKRGEEEKRAQAEVLMVGYYLELGDQLTIKSHSEEEYNVNKEALKLEAPNIQNVLKLCSEQKDPKTSIISDRLASSKIYTINAKSFSRLARTILPGSIVDEFLQGCAKMAETREQLQIKIQFNCLLAGQGYNNQLTEV